MSDNITPEMIHDAGRKTSLIAGITDYLNSKIEHGKTLPTMTDAIMAQLIAKRDAFIAKANAQPDAFFGGLRDVTAAMVALNKMEG